MTKTLSALSQEIADVASNATPSVVQVFGRRGGPSTGIVWDGNGLVITAAHTLEREDGLEIVRDDSESSQATLVGADPRTDVAVVRADVGRPAPDWTDTKHLARGQLAVVCAPLRVALVTIATLHDAWVAPSGGKLDRYIESDAKRFRGFSGSLLLDADGNALGMSTIGLARRTPLTIPTETLRTVVSRLLEHGSVRRGFLGITTTPVRLPEAIASQRVGLLVLSVQPGSPAADAGLYLGDVLLAIDKEVIATPTALLAYLGDERIGTEVVARMLRTGKEITLPIKVAQRGAS